MLGNFMYCNPTKLYFGEDSLNYLNEELPKYGNNVVLISGGGSIKENGIYDAVVGLLNRNGKNIAEISGVMPNPTLAKLYEGIEIANKNPQDYEARSNIMWTATWALNTLVSKGKSTDWMVHMLGQSVGGHTNATHGMTLAAVSLPYYRYIMEYGLEKFKRFAVNVWGIEANGKDDRQLAEEGLKAMENWMKELGLVMNITELGANENMIEAIADTTFTMNGGYKVLDHEEIVEILKASL